MRSFATLLAPLALLALLAPLAPLAPVVVYFSPPARSALPPLTVTSGLSLRKLFSPIPFTFINSCGRRRSLRSPFRHPQSDGGRIHRDLSPLTGRPFGVYQVEAQLGAGGMGEVYRARDTKLGRDVAIKILPRGVHARSRAAGALRARSAHARRAQSPAHRRDLRPRRGRRRASRWSWSWSRARRWPIGSRRGPLPARRTRWPIARQIADALDAAHEQGHRPSRSEARQHQDHAGRRVKVLDFGLAKTERRSGSCGRPDQLADDDDRRHARRDAFSARPPT